MQNAILLVIFRRSDKITNYKNKNKKILFVTFLFLAFLCFAFFSIGGKFLHSHIHHHKDQASHDQCFVSQVQTQVFVLFLAAFIVLQQKISWYLQPAYQAVIIKPRIGIPFSHAPPITVH